MKNGKKAIKKSKSVISSNNTNNNINNNLFKTIILILNLIVIFYSPFVRGLYFEEEQLWAEIIVFITFIFFSITKLLQKDKRFISTPIEYFSLGLVAVYLISIITAVSTRLAISEFIKYCMYFAIFFMITDIVVSIKNKMIVLWTITGTALGLCVIGIDSTAGNTIVNAFNSMFELLHIPVKFFGLFVSDRINSTLQYPNALAAYLMAVLFITLTLSVVCNKKWQKVLAVFCSFINAFTIIFTLSRGVLLLLPLVYIIFILIIPKCYKMEMLANSIIVGLSIIFSVMIPFLTRRSSAGLIANLSANYWIKVLIGVFTFALLLLAKKILLAKLSSIKIKFSMKTLAISAAVFILIIAGLTIIFSIPKELIVENNDTQAPGDNRFEKNIQIKPDRKYKLTLRAAEINNQMDNGLDITIYSRSNREILVGTMTNIAYIRKLNVKPDEILEVPFEVPENSSIVDIYFSNIIKDTKISIDNVKIIDSENGKVKNLKLQYKFMPDSVFKRFENLLLSKSLYERLIFIYDGFKMFKDRWFIGAGGGAWVNLNFTYQSFLYWSTQPHTYMLQVAIETGIVGLLILLMLVISIIIQYVIEKKSNKESDEEFKMIQATLLMSIMSLFLHSILDFDLSLSSVSILLWSLIAVFNSSYRHTKPVIVKEDVKSKHMEKLLRKFNRFKSINANNLAIIIVTVIVLIMPIRYIQAADNEMKYRNSVKENNGAEALNYIKKAVSMDIFNADYKLKCAEILLSGEKISNENVTYVKKLLEEARKLDKYNASIAERISVLYFKLSEVDKGLDEISRAVKLRPFFEQEWSLKLDFYYQVVLLYLNSGDRAKAEEYLDKAINIITESTEINKKNLNPFDFVDESQEKLEKLIYIKDNYDNLDLSQIQKIKFYSVNHMDVNHDKVVDQWNIVEQDKLDYSTDGKSIFVKNTEQYRATAFKTRRLSLEGGKTYRIELVLDNSAEVESVQYFISNYHYEAYVPFEKTDDGIFTAEITLPPDYITENSNISLSINQYMQIRSMTIVEK